MALSGLKSSVTQPINDLMRHRIHPNYTQILLNQKFLLKILVIEYGILIENEKTLMKLVQVITD